jgi:hypothetical protein
MPGDDRKIEAVDELLVEPVIPPYALRHDLDEIVPLPADAVEVDHARDALDMGLEGHRPVLGMMRGLDHHDHHQIEAQPCQIDIGALAAQHAFGLEPLQAPPAGVLRQADRFGQSALAQRGVGLKRHQDLAIDGVDFEGFCGHLIGILAQSGKNR